MIIDGNNSKFASVIHFGKNPIIGGTPLKDNKIIDI